MLQEALDEFYNRDHYLLKTNANERTMSAHIAGYLRSALERHGYVLDVDIEYNRSGLQSTIDSHETDRPDHGQTTKRMTHADGVERDVFPDVIVHKRDSTTCNVLAIEIKKADSSTGDRQGDLAKLRGYATQLGYQHTVLVVLEHFAQWQWLKPQDCAGTSIELCLTLVWADGTAPDNSE